MGSSGFHHEQAHAKHDPGQGIAAVRKHDTDAQYVSLGESLLDASSGGNAFPVYGTHDMNIVQRLVAEFRSL